MSWGQVEKNPNASSEFREGRNGWGCGEWLPLPCLVFVSFRSWPKPKSKRWWAGKWKTFAGQSEVPSKTQKAKARRAPQLPTPPGSGFWDLGLQCPNSTSASTSSLAKGSKIQTAELELRHMGNQTGLPLCPFPFHFPHTFPLRCYENC